MELLKNFIFGDIFGDEEYITDGVLLLRKDRLYLDYKHSEYTKLLKAINNKKIPMEYIPYEKGEEVKMSKIAELGPHNKIYVKFDDKYFDYDYTKLAHCLLDIDYYTVVKPAREERPHLLKFWDCKDRFLGCLSEVVMER